MPGTRCLITVDTTVLEQVKTTKVSDEGNKIAQLETELADVNGDEMEKTSFKEGSRGRQLFSPEPLVLEATSPTIVAHHTTHVRDQEDTVLTERLSDFKMRMTVMPASRRMG